MTKGHMYTDRKEYVETILKAAFEPVPDFKGIKYTRQNDTDSEYIRIDTLIGTVAYFNITALDKETILRDVSKIVLAEGELPKSLIADIPTIRKVAVLFK